MKNTFLILLLLFINSNLFCQSNDDTIVTSVDSHKDWTLVSVDGKLGFIDKEGTVAVAPQYHEINSFGEYHEDWALVSVDGKLGFIDKGGKVAVAPQYHEINSFGEYRKNWALVSVDGKLGFINNKGCQVVKPIFDEIFAKDDGSIDGIRNNKREGINNN